jgi:hypothetical protein
MVCLSTWQINFSVGSRWRRQWGQLGFFAKYANHVSVSVDIQCHTTKVVIAEWVVVTPIGPLQLEWLEWAELTEV